MITIHPKTKQAYQLLQAGTLAFARAERQGISVNIDYLNKKKIGIDKKINKLENEFKESKFYKRWCHSVKNGKPNINSNLQLSRYIYDIKRIDPFKYTGKGNPSTDEEALKGLNLPEVNTLLEIRKLKKIKTTYLEGFEKEQVDGIMHPFFNLHLVKTFRSSSDSPNFQNIPKRDKEAMTICRKAIIPRKGHQLLEADFSGIEVRIAACYHKDSNMLKYITDKTSDMHGDMAVQIFKLRKLDRSLKGHDTLRQASKNGFVFPQFYGSYYKNCAINLINWVQLPHGEFKPDTGIEFENGFISNHLIKKGIKCLDDMINHIKVIENDFWSKRFPEYTAWKEMWWGLYQKYGYIDLKTGFRCSGVMNKNDCINYPVQGAAFHCLLWSFIKLDEIIRNENWNSKIIGQIHDAIIMDVHPDELNHVVKTIKQITTVELAKTWDWIITPMDIEMELCPVNASWAEKEKYKI